MMNRMPPLLAILAGLTLSGGTAHAAAPGADEHTVALWLFDEPTYPNVILTDASRHQNDLRLHAVYDDWYVRTEGTGEPLVRKHGFVPGKSGRALYVPDPSIARASWPDNHQRYSAESRVAGGPNVPEPLSLGYR
jgi:hypothetical protein